ncbi:hypothetical protein [Companilactobacillus paralimentarius]
MQSQRKNISREQMLNRNRKLWDKIAEVEEKPYLKITSYLNQSLVNDSGNNREISIVRRSYDERHRRLVGHDHYENDQNELLIEAFQQENTYIQNLISTKEISRELGSALYEQISTDQLVYLQSLNEE